MLQMRWTDLLFAHWPLPASELSPLIPDGFNIDVYEGTAWVGVVPFRMENTRLRGLPPFPGTDRFPEANVRTYVTEAKSGHPGVFFFRSTQRIRWPLQEHARGIACHIFSPT